MILGKPAPFVSAFVAAVDEAIRAHQPSGGRSAMQRTWLASKRSPLQRSEAAGCRSSLRCAGVGSKEGAGSPRPVASHAIVRSSRT
jgi:hypothetical protein